MNFLIDELPKTTPHGFYIRTDFRECIKFELLMQDKDISNENKVYLALNLFYKDIPTDTDKAIEDILWLFVGEEIKTNTKSNNNSKKTQIYSFDYDSKYIYTSFLQQYNINLNTIEYLHWWEFKALFEGLSDKTKIVEIMGYRSIDLGKIKDKEEKQRYKKLKELYKLPDLRTQEEKERDFGSAFW